MSSMRPRPSENRILILLLVAVSSFFMMDGRYFVYAYEVYEQEEARLQEISELLGLPVETLRRDHTTLFTSLKELFVEPEDPAKEERRRRLRSVLERHQRHLASNPYRPEIQRVQREHAPHRIQGFLRDLAQLTEPKREWAATSQRALLGTLEHTLKTPPRLPHLPEGLPGKARAQHAAMQAHLDRLVEAVRPIVAAARSENALAKRVAQLRQLRLAVAEEPDTPRYAERPLPVRTVEKSARSLELSERPTLSPLLPSPRSVRSTPPQKLSETSLAPEIATLAQTLEHSPAKIFAWVHDRVEFDPQFGAVKGPLGTLLERRGTSWDQAWLLRDLLVAAGVEARIEWGEIEVTPAMLTQMTGLDDPFRAGDLLATAGVPIVLLTEGSRVVAARLHHVWLRAFLDYIPNRGVTSGPGDTWVRMDPSLKRFTQTPGVPVHQHVPFTLAGYLESGTPSSPRRFYEDALTAYNRENMLWVGLDEIRRHRRIVPEAFPYVPGTLRADVVRVDGESTTVPESFQHRVRIEARTASGESLLEWDAPAPAFYGERVEVAYTGATPEDQAVLDEYGGIFDTPPYLVDLKPEVRIGGQRAADGRAVGSAEDVEIRVTLRPVEGSETALVHETLSGERHVLALDLGHLPRELVARHQERLTAAVAAGDTAEAEAQTLYLLGATYLENLGRDLADLAGWKWHRLVRLGTEGLISQSGQVTARAGGEPLTFARAERTVDVARMILGLFPLDGDPTFTRDTLELLGAQSSFLEGEVFAQVLAEDGIASVSALTRARREGQTLTRVDAVNLAPVLAEVELDPRVEDAVRRAVDRGRIAWIAESPLTVHRWTGTGYVLEDPATGAAAFLISGELAGGTETGTKIAIRERLGSEPWLEDGPLGEVLRGTFKLLWGTPSGGPSGGPATNQGDPVNLATGNLWLAEVDLTLPGVGLPTVWSRTYNSRSTYNGPLGYGWTFTFGEHLVEDPDGSVTFREADGTEHVFTPGDDGFVAPPGVHLRLVRGADALTLTAKNGEVKTFDLAGRLRSIADPSGNTVRLDYDAAGHLSTVVDALDREVLRVTVAEGKILRVTDLAGRSVTYGYDGDDLVTVTDATGETWTSSYDAHHNLIERRDPLGHATAYAYDGQDRCYRQIDPLGFPETYAYSDPGSSAVRTDRRGFDAFYELDARGRAITEVDPLGNVRRSTWDDDNNRISTTDALGATTRRTFDARGNLLTETDALGQRRTFTYDPDFSRLVGATDATGAASSQTLDARGNVVSRTQSSDGVSITETFTYDSRGRLVAYVDGNGHETTFGYDPQTGAIARRTDPLGHTMRFTTDEVGRVESVIDPGDNVRSLAWDARDRVVSITDPFGNATSVTYDAAGRLTSVTAPQGTSELRYDAAGRLTSSIDPLGGETRFAYDEGGNVVVRTDPRGHRTTSVYDALDRPLATIDRLGHIWSYAYVHDLGTVGCASCRGGAGSGQASRIVDPLGHVTTRHFDLLGRLTSETDPLGHVTESGYDARGRRIRVTDALGRSTRFEYDLRNRVTAVVEANGARTEATYDAEGHRLTLTDAEGRIRTRSFTPKNQLATEIDPLGNATRYFYDELRDLVRTVKPDGQEIHYEYDRRRLIAVELPGGERETFAYDELGRRRSMSNAEVSLTYAYDALDRVVEVRNATLDETLRYQYDAHGNLIERQGLGDAVRYHYDAMDRLVEVNDPTTGRYRIAYDALGRRARLEYPNGTVTTYVYDEASRLQNLITRDPRGDVVDGYRYIYDAVGRRTSAVRLGDGDETRYVYDDVDRLIRWSDGDDFEAYAYDFVGNRVSTEGPTTSTTLTFDDANRLLREETTSEGDVVRTTSYAWSASGHLVSRESEGAITTYRWDALDRLIDVSAPSGQVQYGYDPTGIRVRETRDGTTRRFLHDSEDLLAVFGATGLEQSFHHGPGFDEPWARVDGADVAYLHRDGLGSVTASSDHAGELRGARRYEPFGALRSATGEPARFAFTARELDDTGLMYYRTRYYDPSVGRYLSLDRFPGRIDVPQSLHRYAYVHNNPVNHVDPTGEVIPQLALAVATLVAFAGGLVLGFALGRSLARSVQLPDVAVGVTVQTGQRTRDHLLGWLALGFFISVIALLFLFQGPSLRATDLWLNWVAPGLCAGSAVLFEFVEGIGFSTLDTWYDILSGLIGCLIATFLVKFFVGLIFFAPTLVVVGLLTGMAIGWGTGILERRHVPLS